MNTCQKILIITLESNLVCISVIIEIFSHFKEAWETNLYIRFIEEIIVEIKNLFREVFARYHITQIPGSPPPPISLASPLIEKYTHIQQIRQEKDICYFRIIKLYNVVSSICSIIKFEENKYIEMKEQICIKYWLNKSVGEYLDRTRKYIILNKFDRPSFVDYPDNSARQRYTRALRGGQPQHCQMQRPGGQS